MGGYNVVALSTDTGEHVCRVSQNHIYTVYVRVSRNHIYTVYVWYFWQEFDQIYGHIRRVYTRF